MSVILLKHDLHEYLDPESSNPVIPSPNNVIEDLFGWISTNTNISLRFRKACWSDRFVRRKQRACAVSTMQGFKSALLWSYLEAKVPFPVETNVCLDNFVLAYKMKVAEKKY